MDVVKKERKRRSRKPKAVAGANKTPQTKPSRQNRPKRNPPGRMHPGINSHHKIACSLLDPFCGHALNAKFPDGQTINTLTYQSRFTLPINISSTGWESLVFSPDTSDYNILTDSGVPGTWNANFTVGDAAMTSVISSSGIAENVRIVSAGFVLRWTYPSTAVRPTVTFADISDSTDLLSQSVSPTLVSGIGQNVKVLVGNQDIYWVMRPVDSNKRNWSTVGASGTNTRSKFYNAAVVHISATASTAYGTMEFITNYEYTVKSGSAYNQFATQPPPTNQYAIAAAKTVQKNNPGAIQADSTTDFTQFLEKKAMGALDQILNYAGGAAMALLA